MITQSVSHYNAWMKTIEVLMNLKSSYMSWLFLSSLRASYFLIFLIHHTACTKYYEKYEDIYKVSLIE
jgi:hypothetical protein